MAAEQVIAVAICFLFTTGLRSALDIEAHQGGRALFPENSPLASFANALSMIEDALELGIRSRVHPGRRLLVPASSAGSIPTSPATPAAPT